MPHFPQLSTGSLAQYPLRILRRKRAAVNEAVGGERFTSYDVFASEIEWDLLYRGLSAEEVANLRNLFEACQGRRGEFSFADPCGNMLARSGQFDQAPWESEAQLLWTGGQEDPQGGQDAMRVQNNSAVAQAFRQSVDWPAIRGTCFSIWVKSLSATEVVVRRTSGPESVTTAVSIYGEWRRIEIAAALAGTTVEVELAVEIPGAATVDLFGAQLEPQPSPSGYKRTLGQSGLYPAARFAQDELAIEGDGFQTHATRVRVVARLQG